MPADPAATRRLIESLSTHLEEHLATWKSSLVDARRDIEALLAALSEKIPAQAKPLFPEDVVSMMLEDVVPPPPPPPEPKVVERVVAGPAGPPDWTIVRSAVSSIESARTQVDVLTRFISQVAAHASRVALLVLRNDRVTGWKALGFDASGGRDEAIRSMDLASEDDPFAADVLRAQRSRLAEPPDEGSPLRKALGGRAPARVLLVPMVIRDRLAGLVYADELPGEEGRLNEAAVEVLTFVTGLAVDLLAARKKIPTPTLTPTGESVERFRPAATAVPAPKRIPSLVFDFEAAPKPPAEAPAAPGPEKPAESPLATSGIRPRPKAAEEQLRALAESAGIHRRPAPPPPDAGVTVAVPILTPQPPPPPPAPTEAAPPPPPTPPPPAPRPAPVREIQPPPPPPPALTIPAPTVPTRPPSSLPPPLSQTTTGEFTEAFEALKASGAIPTPTSPGVPAQPAAAPPPASMTPPPTIPAVGSRAAPSTEVRPISGFIPRSKLGPGGADTPQRQREDARRLARLLVSEIKLYNEKKVEEGRAAGDLYDRLKDDIERSRQVFEERTPDAIRRETDFFREELVRILADGRSEALGPAS
jgi:hypothetical protein